MEKFGLSTIATYCLSVHENTNLTPRSEMENIGLFTMATYCLSIHENALIKAGKSFFSKGHLG
jgi:hypothetical protein